MPFSLVLVCVRVRVLCGASCWSGRGGGGSCAVWLPCVCVCVRTVCGWWRVSYLGWFSSSVGISKSGRRKALEEALWSCSRYAWYA